MLTVQDFINWGRQGGLKGSKTKRKRCDKCKSFVSEKGCKRCTKKDNNQ